jgi:hypothetical protein
MKQSKSITIALTSLMLTLPSLHAIASELDAHEHGSASLDIAIDTNIISMRFESPAVNIVGFEYATDDDQQLLLIQQAKNKLSNFDAVFQLVGDASCQTVESSANWVTKHEEDGHEEDGHEEDGHEEDGHEEDGHEDGPASEHAEFIAEYQLKCNQVNYLTAIDVNLFEFFPGISDLDVQVIHSGGQIKQELDSSNTLIRLAK